MIQIEATEKNINTEFHEQIRSWMAHPPPRTSPCTTGFDHVMLCLHEGTHLLYVRDAGFEPELYGPSDEEVYRHGLGWRRQLGAVEVLPPEISLSADIVLVGKSFFGPVHIQEKFLGADWKKELWDKARGDLANYNNWCVMRGHIVGDVRKTLFDEIRDSIYEDFAQPEFRQRLILASREYESRISGIDQVGNL